MILLKLGKTQSLKKTFYSILYDSMGFPSISDGKEPARNVGSLGLIPGPGIFPGEGNDNPLQYSCLGNSMDREAWRAIVHGSLTVRHD